MEWFARIVGVSSGKIRTRWYFPRSMGYKLFLGFGNKVGVRSDVWIAVPKKVVESVTSHDVSKAKRELDRKIQDRINGIKDLRKKIQNPKYAKYKGTAQKNIKHYEDEIKTLKQKKTEIIPEKLLKGRSLRLIIN